VSKGLLLPTLGWEFLAAAAPAQVVLLVLPQADAALLAFLAKKKLKKPLVVVYQCDVTLPGGWASRLVEKALAWFHCRALSLADVAVASSHDYAQTSPLLRAFSSKVRVIPPPIPQLFASPQQVENLRQRLGLFPQEPIIGWVGRLSREKGLHVLAQAMPDVWQAFPQARVVCVGPREEVAGERAYARKIFQQVAGFGRRWLFCGILREEDLAAFYAACTVLVFPSINRTEAFGLVQVEAMRVGTPVVASHLPGVREPVERTGMGLLVPPEDPKALGQALKQVFQRPEAFRKNHPQALEVYAPERVAQRYAALFQELVSGSWQARSPGIKIPS
jgi:glycosyltransferase involved in cell wall biosynthesis